MKIYAATQKGVQKAQNEDRVVLNQNILSMGIHECECTEEAVENGSMDDISVVVLNKE